MPSCYVACSYRSIGAKFVASGHLTTYNRRLFAEEMNFEIAVSRVQCENQLGHR